MSMKLTSVLLPSALKRGLKLVADRDGVRQSEQIRRALEAWLEQRDALPQKRAAQKVKKRR